jgi:hypothetical protein
MSYDNWKTATPPEYDEDPRNEPVEPDGPPRSVSPAEIARQRELGWPDFYPEDYCHICGGDNPPWVTDRETWLIATKEWASRTGREGICCPSCFARMYFKATGVGVIWNVRPELP